MNILKRKIYFLTGIAILILVTGASVFAASSSFNKQINYQGKLGNLAGVTVADGDYAMIFRLYTSSSGATPVWTETWTSTTTRITVTSGLFSTLLGSLDSIASVNFNQDLYLGVTMGGSSTPPVWDPEMTPRKRLGAVPSAFVADTLDGLDSDSFLRSDDSDTMASSSAGTLLTLSQTGAGNILSLQNTTGAVLTVTNSGNVGIGTTSPYAALSVVGASGVVADHYSATGTATNTAASGWNISAGCFAINGTCLNIGSGLTGAGVANRAAFWTASGNLSYDDTFVWDNTNKRLGIGTTSPYAPLSVAGTVVADNFIATSTTSTSTFAGSLVIGTSTPDSIALFEVGTSSPSLFVSKLSGRVGIGTAAPGVALQVEGPTTINSGTLRLNNGNLIFGTVGNNITLGGESIVFQANGINVTSNLGISTTSPYAALSVVGASGVVADHYTATGTATNTATSGWNISAGCFAINGTCLTSGTGETSGYPFTPATNFGALTSATTSALWSQTAFYASSTFIADNSTTTNATTTSLYISGATTTRIANGVNLLAGCYAINGVCVGGGTSGALADWVKETNYAALALTPSTTLPVWFKDYLYSSSSAIFEGSITATNVTATGTVTATNLLVTSSSTLKNLTFDNATGTSATTTFLAISSLASTSRLIVSDPSATSTFAGAITVAGQATSTFSKGISFSSFSQTATSTGTKGIDLSGGCFAINGTCLAGGTGETSGYPFTPTTNFGALTSATTSALWSQTAFYASSTFIADNSTTTNATTTSLYISGATTTRIANGVNLLAGCFAINGVCVGGGSSGALADWVKETNYAALALTPSTTIPVWFKSYLYSSSSAIFSGSGTSSFAGPLLTTSYLVVGTTTPQASMGAGDIWANGIFLSASSSSITGDDTDLIFQDSTAGVKTLSQLVNSTSQCTIANTIISGGIVTWTGSGYNFDVSPVKYCIGGLLYEITSTSTVSLAASDPSLDRVDVIIANNASSTSFLTGVPATNPVAPAVNPNSQIALTFIFVQAGSTQPSINQQRVYQENIAGEWTGSQVTPVGEVDFNSTNNPYQGTKTTEVTTPLRNGDYFSYATSSTWDPTGYVSLSFYIKNISDWSSDIDRLSVTFRDASGAQVGSVVILQEGSYGFDRRSNLYQKIAVPLADFGSIGGSAIKSLRFTANPRNNNNIDFYIDNILLEGSFGPSNPPTGVRGSGLNNQITFWTGSTTISGSPNFIWDNTTNKLGIGTTTPAGTLGIVGNIYASSTATSTFQGNGINLLGGCFAINGTCLAAGTGETSGYPFTPTTNFGALTSATTSALWSQTAFYASSTFIADNATTTNATTTSLYISGATTTRIANGVNLLAGCYAINGVCLNIGSGLTGSGVSGRVTFWNGAGSITSSSTFLWDDTLGNLSIGTTTDNRARLNVQKNVTDPSTSVADFGMLYNYYPTITSTAYHNLYGVGGSINPVISTGVTEQGVLVGIHGASYRDKSEDQGTITDIRNYWGGFGNYVGLNTSAVTTNAYGSLMSAYANTGSITNLYGYYLQNGGGDANVGTSTGLYLDPIVGSTTYAIITTNGKVGFGTTSPYAALSVVGASGVVADKYTATNTNATSTLAGFLATKRLDITGTVTSTAASGWNLTAGCFAINGTCLNIGSGLTGSGATNRAAFWTASGNLSYDDTFVWDNTNKRLGIGTTSPYAPLSVMGEISGSFFTGTTTATSSIGGPLVVGGYIYGSTTASGTLTLRSTPNDTKGFIIFGSNSAYDEANNSLAIGTTTPSSVLDIQKPLAGPVNVLVTGYGGAPQFISRRAGGTPQTPTAVVAGNALFSFFGQGYDGSAFSTHAGQFNVVANENFSSTNQGTRITFATTPNGSTASDAVKRFVIGANGGIIIGSSTAPTAALQINPDPGYGNDLVTVSSSTINKQVFVITNAGNLGIATTSPYAALSVVGASGVVADHYDATNTNATSTFSGFLATKRLDITGTVTSTAASGINITAGCFAINGVCIGGGGGTPGGTDGQIQYNNGGSFGGGTAFIWDDINNRLGVGTTTPGYPISLSGNTALDFNLLTIGSSSASSITINYQGVSTTTIPNNQKYAWSIATSTTGTSLISFDTRTVGAYATTTFGAAGFDVNSGAIQYDPAANKTSIENLELGPVAFEEGAGWVSWIDMRATTTSANSTAQAYTAQVGGYDLLTVYSQADGTGLLKNYRVIVGTTTNALMGNTNIPSDSLIVANGSVCVDKNQGIQCAGTAMSRGQIWSYGGANFFASSTGVVGISTTSPYAALSVVGASGVVADKYFATNTNATSTFAGAMSIGTTTSSTTLYVQGSVQFASLPSGPFAEGAENVCIDPQGRLLSATAAGTCAASSQRFKNNIEGLNVGLDTLLKLRPTQYYYTNRQDWGQMMGFIAEEVDTIDPRLAFRLPDGTVQGVRYDIMTSLITKSVQELNTKLDTAISGGEIKVGSSFWMTDEMGRIEAPGDVNFAGHKLVNVGSIESLSGKWSIDESGRLTAKELCLEDVCVGKTELKALLDNAGISPTQTPPLPTDTPPADSPPTTDTPPTDQPPTDTPPADEPPTDTPPADTPPAPEPPADTSPPPADNPPPTDTP